jgi:hypothetical protein
MGLSCDYGLWDTGRKALSLLAWSVFVGIV